MTLIEQLSEIIIFNKTIHQIALCFFYYFRKSYLLDRFQILWNNLYQDECPSVVFLEISVHRVLLERVFLEKVEASEKYYTMILHYDTPQNLRRKSNKMTENDCRSPISLLHQSLLILIVYKTYQYAIYSTT